MADLMMDNARNPDIHNCILQDRTKYSRDAVRVGLYRAYAEGDHKNTVATDVKAFLQGLLDHDFCDNVCHQIIAEASDRLTLLRWSCSGATLQTYLNDLFVMENVDDISGDIHYDQCRDGNHAVSVEWDEVKKRVCLHREPWWDGNTGVYIHYDEDNEPAYAVKEWIGPEGRRRIVWYDDSFERYIGNGPPGVSSSNATWEPYQLEGDSSWPMPWVKTTGDGSPLHIPIIHFPNAGRGYLNYGTSEISGGVIGFQDQLNDLQWDMSAAGRMTGFQMVTIAGIRLGKIKMPDGSEVEVQPAIGPGQVLTSTSHETRFGTIPAGDLGQLLSLYNQKLKSVARMTRTPLHAITGGDWPSGEALLRAEQPAVGKANRQVRKLRVCWATVAHRAVELANRFGGQAFDEKDIISAHFDSTERRDPLSKSIIVVNLGDTISKREGLRIMGYSDEEAETILEEKSEEATQAADTALLAFSRGTAAGTRLPGSGAPPKAEVPSPSSPDDKVPAKVK